jgi:hypothetical protein
MDDDDDDDDGDPFIHIWLPPRMTLLWTLAIDCSARIWPIQVGWSHRSEYR